MAERKILEKQLNYKFKNKNLLSEALIHSSYSNEITDEIKNNERLEFLGDAVLEIIISKYLFYEFPDSAEGELTKIRSRIVCEDTLYEIAKKYNLGDYIKFGKGEILTGGRDRKSNLANCFEALVAAVYLDSDIEITEHIFLENFKEYASKAKEGELNTDYKTKLQEYVQKKDSRNRLRYTTYKETGPDHNKTFHVIVSIDKTTIASGKGKSKKNAEQDCARNALEKYYEKEY